MSISDDGFIQDYDLNVKQELWLYCRLCRNTFPVVFKPKNDAVKLQCVCGHEGRLGEMDVFRSEADCREHAAFYERVYRAAKGALKDAGIPLPPSGKWSRVEDIMKDSSFESYFNSKEDGSAIRDGYIEPDDSDVSPTGIAVCLADFDRRLAEVSDVLAKHELLSEMIVWTYCRRHLNDQARAAFYRACEEDIAMAHDIIVATKAALKRGSKQRLSFTSFKHLLVDLEEVGELEKALVVAERAAGLGLKKYAQRVVALRNKLGL